MKSIKKSGLYYENERQVVQLLNTYSGQGKSLPERDGDTGYLPEIYNSYEEYENVFLVI